MKKILFILIIILIIVFSTVYTIFFTKSGNYFLANYIEKSFNKKHSELALKIDQLRIEIDLIHLEASFNDSSKIKFDAIFSLLKREATANYVIDIKDLSLFNSVSKLELNGDLKILGDLKHKRGSTNLAGVSNIAKSKTDYNISLKNFKASEINFEVKNGKIEELLSIVNEPVYSTGDINISSKLLKNNSGFFDGILDFDIRNAKLNNYEVEKKIKYLFKQDIKYSLNTRNVFKDSNINSKIDFNSNLAKISINDFNYDFNNMVINSDYRAIVNDLEKIKEFTLIPLKGSVVVAGNLFKDSKSLKFDGSSKILDGNMNFTLLNNDLKLYLNSVNSRKLLYMLKKDEFFDSKLDVDLNYNIQNGNGNFFANIKNGHLIMNSLTKKIKDLSTIDVTKELYEEGNIKSEITLDKIVSNLYLKGSKSIIETKNSKLDFVNNEIDTKLDINLNGNKFSVFLTKSLDNPNIKIDIKNLLQETIRKNINNEHIYNKVDEIMNKNGIEDRKDVKKVLKYLF